LAVLAGMEKLMTTQNQQKSNAKFVVRFDSLNSTLVWTCYLRMFSEFDFLMKKKTYKIKIK